jgi:hypothetical protein
MIEDALETRRRPQLFKRLALIISVLLLSLFSVTAYSTHVVSPAYADIQRATRVVASISSQYPRQYTYVTVTARVTDQYGKPIRNAKVVFMWKFKTVTRYETKYTNTYGNAMSRRYISGATKGYKVYVYVSATSGGKTVRTYTWFVPR